VIKLKSKRELERMATACEIVADALALVRKLAKPGVTTSYLDKQAEKRIISRSAQPAFKGHGASGRRPPFPATICASVNEEVVHGIPDDRELREGDLLSVDCGSLYRGYYGDGAVTVPIGEVSAQARLLMDTCREALELAIEAVGPGKRLSDIGRTVQKHVEGRGFSVVRDLVGHGIGSSLWEEPQVPNYYNPSLPDVVLRPGMTLAIEPMINAGGWKVKTTRDHWVVVTRDGSLSSHFEHTIVITDDGAEVLTKTPATED